jgi:hypothetical protein
MTPPGGAGGGRVHNAPLAFTPPPGLARLWRNCGIGPASSPKDRRTGGAGRAKHEIRVGHYSVPFEFRGI